jgi:hypothetical protein
MKGAGLVESQNGSCRNTHLTRNHTVTTVNAWLQQLSVNNKPRQASGIVSFKTAGLSQSGLRVIPEEIAPAKAHEILVPAVSGA